MWGSDEDLGMDSEIISESDINNDSDMFTLDTVLKVLDIKTTVFFTVLTFLYLWLCLRKPMGLPPGPKWRTILLGHLRAFTRHSDIRITLKEFRETYGEVYSLFLGRKLVVVINGLDALKEAFVKQGDDFLDRPETCIPKIRTNGHGLVNANGERWTAMRNFSNYALHQVGFGKQNDELKIHNEMPQLINMFEKHNLTPFDPRHALMTSICNVTCSVTLGTSYYHDNQEFQHVLELTEKISELDGSTTLLNFLPLLRFLPGDYFKLKVEKKLTSEIKAFFHKRIQERKCNANDPEAIDYTSVYLQQMAKNKQIPEATKHLTELDLQAALIDLFRVGIDPITTTLRWAIVYLINNPDMQEHVFKEIDAHIGTKRIPSLADRNNLAYTEAFIMETQRLANQFSVGLPHTVTQDIKFREYLIPKGTIVLPDMHSVMADPWLWKDPEAFRPERFISEKGTIFTPDGFIPFFIGRRNCMGEHLAKAELYIFFATLVQKFRFLSPEGVNVTIDQLDGVFGVARAPGSFNIIAELRNKADGSK